MTREMLTRVAAELGLMPDATREVVEGRQPVVVLSWTGDVLHGREVLKRICRSGKPERVLTLTLPPVQVKPRPRPARPDTPPRRLPPCRRRS